MVEKKKLTVITRFLRTVENVRRFKIRHTQEDDGIHTLDRMRFNSLGIKCARKYENRWKYVNESDSHAWYSHSLPLGLSSFALVRVQFSLTKRIRIECMICRHIVWLHQLHFGSDCCLNGNVMIIILRWHRKKFLNILCWLQNKSSGMSIKIVSTARIFLFLQETDMENEWNV